MSKQMPIEQNDEDIMYFFKNFEKIITGDKANTNWEAGTDFKIFKEYLIKDIKGIQEKLENSKDDYLYYVCEHVFDLLDWIKLIVEDAGFPTFGTSLERVFDEYFGNKHVLQDIYKTSFGKWISGKSGQYKIGENYYNILNSKLYYHNRFGQWFEVDEATVFDLKPNQEVIKDDELIEKLNLDYEETWYDKLIKKWEDNKYSGKLPKDFLEFSNQETSPEEYFNFSVSHIKKLLDNPVSIKELENWNGDKIEDLEHIIKIANFVIKITNKRRSEDSHTLYLLRDCLLFQEIQKVLDYLEGEETSSDQVLIGRKLLSHKPGAWGYYVATLEALYTAHLRYPKNFSDFYNEYSRLLNISASVNPRFATIISNLSEYVKKHLKTGKNKIVVFDIGFQGSIALFVKYIIDQQVKPQGRIETDIQVGVGAQWSKELFGNRYDSDYFPMLNRVQLMTRSNELYQYIEGSFKSGNLRVEMGDKATQHKAAMELAVLVMVAILMHENV